MRDRFGRGQVRSYTKRACRQRQPTVAVGDGEYTTLKNALHYMGIDHWGSRNRDLLNAIKELQ